MPARGLGAVRGPLLPLLRSLVSGKRAVAATRRHAEGGVIFRVVLISSHTRHSGHPSFFVSLKRRDRIGVDAVQAAKPDMPDLVIVQPTHYRVAAHTQEAGGLVNAQPFLLRCIFHAHILMPYPAMSSGNLRAKNKCLSGRWTDGCEVD